MRAAEWTSLEEKIIRPGIEEKLIPLMLYRGSRSLGRMHRLWNFAINCMEHEVENYSQAVKLAYNPDFAHLCGPHRPVNHTILPSLFGRLLDNPRVTDNIPRLTDYVRFVNGQKFRLVRIPEVVNNFEFSHMGRYAPWRIVQRKTFLADGEHEKDGIKFNVADGIAYLSVAQIMERPELYKGEWFKLRKLKAKPERTQKREELFYPYIVHNPSQKDDSASLVMEVNAAVPQSLPDFIRADVCQDLVVAILTGEVDRAELKGSVRGFTRKVCEMHPMKYGPLSLDAFISAEDDRTIADRMLEYAE